jgi:hypothetical protein
MKGNECRVYNIEWDLKEYLEENPNDTLEGLRLPHELTIVVPLKYNGNRKTAHYVSTYLNGVYKVPNAGFSFQIVEDLAEIMQKTWEKHKGS